MAFQQIDQQLDNAGFVYPYADIALCVFSRDSASNSTSAERSFSTFKHVKSYLRTSANDSRLNNLAILHIGVQSTTPLGDDETIDDFVRTSKTRRKIEFRSSVNTFGNNIRINILN